MDNKSYNNGTDFTSVESTVKKVRTTVENAVKNNDYQELNRSITDMVNETLRQYQQIHPSAVSKNGSSGQNVSTVKKTSESCAQLYAGTHVEKIKDIILIIVGACIGCKAGILFLWTLVSEIICHDVGVAPILLTLIFTLLGVWAIYSGVCGLGRIKRFKKYIRAIGDRTYCDFEHLAGVTGREIDFVKKDVRGMIRKGWFMEGAIDKAETCLITSTETYRQYKITEKSYTEKKVKEENIQKKDIDQSKNISPDVQEILDKGNMYIKKIHDCNDAIPGEEISAKIVQIEQIVEQIFKRVQDHPEIIPDLRKLMEYYLPTTVKLLEAYEDMDKQVVQGETIKASKKEIEDTLDTLNEAFAKLLDSVFHDTALDVSTDISVLNTMLAQEGLTKDAFERR